MNITSYVCAFYVHVLVIHSSIVKKKSTNYGKKYKQRRETTISATQVFSITTCSLMRRKVCYAILHTPYDQQPKRLQQILKYSPLF